MNIKEDTKIDIPNKDLKEHLNQQENLTNNKYTPEENNESNENKENIINNTDNNVNDVLLSNVEKKTTSIDF